MKKQISVVKTPESISEFDKLPKRSYSKDSPPLKRVFDIQEKWYVVSGDISFTDDSTGQAMKAAAGNVIVLPKSSKFSTMRFGGDALIKQYIDDEKERNRISTNIKINYLIIKTILEIIDKYEDFLSVPNDSMDILFEGAEYGTLYKYTDDWNIVDAVIRNFVARTGINKSVWYGNRRLRTGLRYNKPKWNSILSIDFIDLSQGTTQQQKDNYESIKADPLDLLQGINVKYDDLYTLENLLIFIARKMKNKEELSLKNAFPSDVILRQLRNAGIHLNKKGMLHYILYGQELETAIKRLFWATSKFK